MVANGAQSVRIQLRAMQVVAAKVDGMVLVVAFDMGAGGVNMESAKVLGELLLLLRTDVFETLVTEDDDATLGYEQGKLVLLSISQFGQLDAADLGANAGCETSQRYAWVAEEMGFGLVSLETAVCEIERLRWWKYRCFVVHWQIRGIFVLKSQWSVAAIRANHGHCPNATYALMDFLVVSGSQANLPDVRLGLRDGLGLSRHF